MMNVTVIRSVGLAVLSVLTATGVLGQETTDLVRENADSILAGVLGVWSVIAGRRAVKEHKAAKAS